ncbi:hypothetical protein CBM2606_A30157 [Cupriavidus taiwanensis]|nr:hypothetical protein CBM2606_A30157 [Cupriavidus taiwanensis]
MGEAGAGARQGHSDGLITHFHWPFLQADSTAGHGNGHGIFVYRLGLQG